MKTILRLAIPEDAPKLGRITHEAFTQITDKHGFLSDFPDAEMPTGLLAGLIARDDVYVVVAEQNDEIVGSNVLWENNPVAGIGPVSVDPNIQGSSIGRLLMENAVKRAKNQGFDSIRLVQTPFNCLTLALYSKIGFDVTEPLSVFNGPTINETITGYEVRPATSRDLTPCNDLCIRIHGHDRHGDLGDAISGGSATVVERNGAVTGYATMIGYFGHAVGESNDDIKALISAAPAFIGPGFHIPSRNAELMRWCLNKGLHIMHPMTLMKIGPYQEPKGSFIPSVIF